MNSNLKPSCFLQWRSTLRKTLFSFVIALSSASLFAHGVQVAWCFSPTGDIRIYIEHWHGAFSSIPSSSTVDVTVAVSGGSTTTLTVAASGVINGTTLGNLPCDPANPIIVLSASSQANTHNNWAYWDTPIPQGICPGGATVTVTVSNPNDANYANYGGIYPASATTTIINCPSGPSCDVAISSVNTTAETCDMGHDGSLTINASSSNPPMSYAISGPTSATNGTGVFNNLPPGNYSVSVTDAIGGTCEATSTGMVPASMAMCPTASRTSADDPTIFDPCSCADPLNYTDGGGNVTYFHDYVEVTSATGETWEVSAVSASAFSDNGATNIMIGDALTETMPGSGIYRIDLFHPAGVGFTMDASRTAGGPPFTLSTGGLCNPCMQIPTIGQWGLIILGLLILTFGVVVLRSREMAIAGYSSAETSKFSRLPFDKALFGKALIVVMLGLAATFAVAVTAFGYEMTTADVPGSLVAGPMLAYLLHLISNKKG